VSERSSSGPCSSAARSLSGSTSTSSSDRTQTATADRRRVRPNSARWAGGVGGASGGGKAEGNPTLEPGLTRRLTAAFPHVRGSVAGTGFEPVKAMPAILQVAAPAPRGSPAIPAMSRPSPMTCANGLPTVSAVPWRPHPFCPVSRGLASGGGKLEGTPDHQPQPHRPAPSRYQGHAPRAQRTGLRPSWRLTDSATTADGAWVSPFGTTGAPIGCPIPPPRQGWDRGE
jgi:hypothetical protein